ncbi:MAG: YfhO family protein [Chloroflexota bacterium]|nr:YfhO family protein [Chloroflexota bacterium]
MSSVVSPADAAAIASLALLTALAAGNRFAFDTWLARFDFYTFFVPWYAFLGERLRDFDIPGWNPHLFSGTPFAGDPESGWMYLPAMLAFPFFQILTGFKVLAGLHLAIAGISTYAFARVLGLGPVAALVAAVAYVVGPLLQWNTYCCLVLAQFATWVPLALLGVEMALRAREWRGRILPWCASGFAISQMYAGWVGQGWLIAPLLIGAYIGYRTLVSPPRSGIGLRPRLMNGVTTGIATLGLGLALGAAGILVRLDANAQSNLAGADYTEQGSAGILNPPWQLDYLLSQVLGGGYDQRRAALGGAVVVLALLAPFLAWRRFAVPFFAALTLVSMILTLDTTPLHRLFYLIPRFQVLHEHDAWRIYTIATIGPALLSGVAIEALPAWWGRRSRLPIVGAPLLLMIATAILIRPSQGFIGWPPLIAAAVATALIGAAVITPRCQRRMPRPGTVTRWVPISIVVVVFAIPTGLEITGSWLGWPKDASWERHWRPDPMIAQSLTNEVTPGAPEGAGGFLRARLRESGPFRYVGYGGVAYPGDDARQGSYMGRRFEPAVQALLVNGRPIFLDLYEIQGYNPIELARYAEFMTAVNGAPQNYHTAYLFPTGVRSPLLDLLNVRYVLVDATLPPDREDVVALTTGRREVFRTSDVVIYEREVALPHAWIVHDIRSVERGEALPLLTSGAIDPYRTAVIEGASPQAAPPTAPGEASARVTHYAPDTLTIEANASAPGLLVVSEIYERGWRATVDGEPVDIVPTNHALRGVPLPAGEHTVELRYAPRSLRLGLAISATTAAAMLVIVAFAGWTWLRRGPAPTGVQRAAPSPVARGERGQT